MGQDEARQVSVFLQFERIILALRRLRCAGAALMGPPKALTLLFLVWYLFWPLAATVRPRSHSTFSLLYGPPNQWRRSQLLYPTFRDWPRYGTPPLCMCLGFDPLCLCTHHQVGMIQKRLAGMKKRAYNVNAEQKDKFLANDAHILKMIAERTWTSINVTGLQIVVTGDGKNVDMSLEAVHKFFDKFSVEKLELQVTQLYTVLGMAGQRLQVHCVLVGEGGLIGAYRRLRPRGRGLPRRVPRATATGTSWLEGRAATHLPSPAATEQGHTQLPNEMRKGRPRYLHHSPSYSATALKLWLCLSHFVPFQDLHGHNDCICFGDARLVEPSTSCR